MWDIKNIRGTIAVAISTHVLLWKQTLGRNVNLIGG